MVCTVKSTKRVPLSHRINTVHATKCQQIPTKLGVKTLVIHHDALPGSRVFDLKLTPQTIGRRLGVRASQNKLLKRLPNAEMFPMMGQKAGAALGCALHKQAERFAPALAKQSNLTWRTKFAKVGAGQLANRKLTDMGKKLGKKFGACVGKGVSVLLPAGALWGKGASIVGGKVGSFVGGKLFHHGKMMARRFADEY